MALTWGLHNGVMVAFSLREIEFYCIGFHSLLLQCFGSGILVGLCLLPTSINSLCTEAEFIKYYVCGCVKISCRIRSVETLEIDQVNLRAFIELFRWPRAGEILAYLVTTKGVFNLSIQLAKFYWNWWMQGGKRKFTMFHGLSLPHFLN